VVEVIFLPFAEERSIAAPPFASYELRFLGSTNFQIKSHSYHFGKKFFKEWFFVWLINSTKIVNLIYFIQEWMSDHSTLFCFCALPFCTSKPNDQFQRNLVWMLTAFETILSSFFIELMYSRRKFILRSSSCVAATSSFVAKVRGELWAHFQAVAVKRHSSMRNWLDVNENDDNALDFAVSEFALFHWEDFCFVWSS
jgi:hypothetical protein